VGGGGGGSDHAVAITIVCPMAVEFYQQRQKPRDSFPNSRFSEVGARAAKITSGDTVDIGRGKRKSAAGTLAPTKSSTRAACRSAPDPSASPSTPPADAVQSFGPVARKRHAPQPSAAAHIVVTERDESEHGANPGVQPTPRSLRCGSRDVRQRRPHITRRRGILAKADFTELGTNFAIETRAQQRRLGPPRRTGQKWERPPASRGDQRTCSAGHSAPRQ